MLKKPSNYDEIVVNEYDYTPLTLGGHKGIIINAEEYTGMTGNTSLKITVDTDKTDSQPNYFSDAFESDTRTDKKWSNGAIKYVSLKEDETCQRMLKAFITSVENSNANFTFNWGQEVSQLKGKKVGLVFGLEEYTAQDGTTKTATKLNQIRSIDKVDNAKIPKVKTINKEYIDYEEYMNRSKSNSVEDTFKDAVEITDDLLD